MRLNNFPSPIFLGFVFLLLGCASVDSNRDIFYKKGLFFERMLIKSVFNSPVQKSVQVQGTIDGMEKKYALDVSSIGFDPVDSTTILQTALDSGAPYILIPKMDGPWISGQLFVRSNTTIVFGEGAELVAKRGSFLGTSESLLNINDVENVAIFGYDVTIRMHKEDYRKAPYAKGEWRHTININGCRNVYIFGIRAENSGGDGIYLGAGTSTFNEDIYIKDVILRNNYRQGISVISAQRLLIKDVEIYDTEGTPPSAGIDFEPNLPEERLVDCTVSNSIMERNAGAGVLIYLERNDQTTVPFSIKIEDCSINGNAASILLWGTHNHARGELVLSGNNLCGFSWIPESIKEISILRK